MHLKDLVRHVPRGVLTPNLRADLVGDPKLPSGRSREEQIEEWFNRAAFALPAVGTDGSAGRNIVEGPGVKNVDFGLFRDVPLGGRSLLQLRLEATNVCVASCLFCAFARLRPGDAGAYTMSLDDAWEKLRRRRDQPLTEIHVVNGLHPDLPFDYYTELLKGFKRIRPDVQLKCFTAVEIAFFADLYGKTDEQVLIELREAGLDSLPGGGAEIFAERVRKKIANDKCGTTCGFLTMRGSAVSMPSTSVQIWISPAPRQAPTIAAE